MKYAIVINGKVDNLIELDDEANYPLAEGQLVKLKKDQYISIGWMYKNGKFVEPAPEKPVKPVAPSKPKS